MIRAIVFDLDDTLYEAWTYIRSGFTAVADELAARGLAERDAAVDAFVDLHRSAGPSNVFDGAAARLGLSADLVPRMVDVYRAHEPSGLTLEPDVVELLGILRATVKVGVVTDGWLAVQQTKARVLDLDRHVDAIVYSDQFGRERWKPDPCGLLHCLELLGCAPSEAIYVGDNPGRDVGAAQAAGASPVLLRTTTGQFSEEPVPAGVVVVDDLGAVARMVQDESGVHA